MIQFITSYGNKYYPLAFDLFLALAPYGISQSPQRTQRRNEYRIQVPGLRIPVPEF
jgi:hypothetical protein